MKEHIARLDADVIGMSEVDAIGGTFSDAYL